MSSPESNSNSEPIVISIDAGTTGVRAFAVDLHGRPADMSYREFPQHFPQPGWVEHDPADIWAATVEVLGELYRRLERPVTAIGITDQRETVVAWDRSTGRARHNAIVWQDRRTASRCEELVAAGELPHIRSTTGLVLDPYFSATKMQWLLEQGGVAADDDLLLGTIDSWIIWNLTGGTHVTDTSNASRTMLFDIAKLEWSEELCDLFGVPLRALPAVVPSSGVVGHTSGVAGVPAGIPISGIAGDQQAALFGQACVRPGMAKNTYGTGSFVLMNIGDRCPAPVEGLLSTVAWTLPRAALGAVASGGDTSGDGASSTITHYALEGSIFVTGAAVQWLRDGLGLIESSAEVGPLAESVDSTGGMVLVPAFTGLGSPYWDPYARGTVLGITRGVGRAELARATVESMAFQTRDVVDAMAAASGTTLGELRVDGGAAVMDLLLRLQADQLGVTVRRSAVAETTALGAALLAGLGVGIWRDVEEVGANWASDATVEPSPDRTEADADYAQWQRAVERSRGWALPEQG